MANHLVAALYFEDVTKQEHRPEERERLLVLARSFRWLAIADAKQFIEIPKRPGCSFRPGRDEAKAGLAAEDVIPASQLTVNSWNG